MVITKDMPSTEPKLSLIGSLVYLSPYFSSRNLKEPLDPKDTMPSWLMENTFGTDINHRFMFESRNPVYVEIVNTVQEEFNACYRRQIAVRWQPVEGQPPELLEVLIKSGYRRLKET